MSPCYTCPPAYHTHLAGHARTVSLHRACSLLADYPARRVEPSKLYHAANLRTRRCRQHPPRSWLRLESLVIHSSISFPRHAQAAVPELFRSASIVAKLPRVKIVPDLNPPSAKLPHDSANKMGRNSRAEIPLLGIQVDRPRQRLCRLLVWSFWCCAHIVGLVRRASAWSLGCFHIHRSAAIASPLQSGVFMGGVSQLCRSVFHHSPTPSLPPSPAFPSSHRPSSHCWCSRM